VSLAFLLPAGLAALAAVLLPLIIHLARRSEQRPTVFAALQWLRQKPKPRHRIRFDEWPLLLVRLLLVALTALLLARPVLFGADSGTPWVVVVPGVDAARARSELVAKDARWHWLSPGFPSLVATSPAKPDASITSLLRELDAQLPADVALTVLVPEQLDGVDAQVPRLSRRVDWRVVRVKQSQPDVAAERASAPNLVVRYAPARADAVRYLRAASNAWQAPVTDIAPSTRPLPPRSMQLAWLVPGSVPVDIIEWTGQGGTVLLDAQASIAGLPNLVPLWRDRDGTTLVEGAALGNGKVMRLTRSLAPADMPVLLDGDFPRQLRALFDPVPRAPARVAAADHAPTTGGSAFPPIPRDLAQWLLALIALVFAIERWMATGRRRGVAT
jgi:hypothetical protein